MHVIISIQDQANGDINVISHAHPMPIDGNAQATPATELADFLQKAIDVWQATKYMEMPQAIKFVQSCTRSSNDPSNTDTSAIHGGRKPTIN